MDVAVVISRICRKSVIIIGALVKCRLCRTSPVTYRPKLGGVIEDAKRLPTKSSGRTSYQGATILIIRLIIVEAIIELEPYCGDIGDGADR